MKAAGFMFFAFAVLFFTFKAGQYYEFYRNDPVRTTRVCSLENAPDGTFIWCQNQPKGETNAP